MPWRSEDQKEWFTEFVNASERDLCTFLEAQGERFPSAAALLGRYRAAAKRLLEEGPDAEPDFQSAHNELSVALALLENVVEPQLVRLDYEPAMASCEKRFDFRAAFEEGPPTWVEVKTICPAWQDDWERFRSHVESGRFPDNAHIILSEQGLGGELYHNSFSARSKMLAYTLETEAKVAACLQPKGLNVVVLALCSNGFAWHVDELEDFLFLYRRGRHYDGDPFRLMEAYEIEREGVQLTRSIDHFAFIKRPDTALKAQGGVWSVKPPRWPPWADGSLRGC